MKRQTPQRILLLAAFALAGTLSVVALAQDSMDFEVDDVDPVDGADFADPDAPKSSPAIGNDEDSLKTIYKGDQLFGTKLRLERHMGLYLVRFPQRDVAERIDIKGKEIKANVWVSIGNQTEDDLACKAVEWLVFGRTKWALGARGVFGDFPDSRKVTINFINIQNRDRDSKKDRKMRKIINVMTVTLSRSRFEKLKPSELRDALKKRKCSTVARETLSTYKFNDKYYEKYQDDR